jgi:hypothetical protein
VALDLRGCASAWMMTIANKLAADWADEHNIAFEEINMRVHW